MDWKLVYIEFPFTPSILNLESMIESDGVQKLE